MEIPLVQKISPLNKLVLQNRQQILNQFLYSFQWWGWAKYIVQCKQNKKCGRCTAVGITVKFTWTLDDSTCLFLYAYPYAALRCKVNEARETMSCGDTSGAYVHFWFFTSVRWQRRQFCVHFVADGGHSA